MFGTNGSRFLLEYELGAGSEATRLAKDLGKLTSTRSGSWDLPGTRFEWAELPCPLQRNFMGVGY